MVLKILSARPEDNKHDNIEPDLFSDGKLAELFPKLWTRGTLTDVSGGSSEKYECWILERYLPSDELSWYPHADSQKILLRGAARLTECFGIGYNLTDVHFSNFGVCIHSEKEKHHLRVIDAEWREPDEKWNKSTANHKARRDMQTVTLKGGTRKSTPLTAA